jgi:hypothetical protein
MSIILDCFGTIVLFVTLTAVEFCLDRASWLRPPHVYKGLLAGNHLQAAIKSAASTASAAEAMTNLIMVAIVRTAPLKRGDGLSSERKMCAPALLRDQVSLRYPASAHVQSTMSLTL